MTNTQKIMIDLMTEMLNNGIPRSEAYNKILAMGDEIARSTRLEASKSHEMERRLKRSGIDNQ